MQIYNSLTKEKQEFIPIKKNLINMYTCGVTVYDDCHIGHARSLYIFDVIRRYLEYRGYKVNFVRNITDIDDKIIKRANELNTDWKELVDKYIASYKDDLKALGIRQGLVDKDGQEPRATKSIPDMIEYIKVLIEKGYAYEIEGDVYFDVRSFPEYGKLSGQNIDQMREGVRIEADSKKKDPLDFALWKESKENEPSWESPWGKGRPGWHIECSVMSQKFLKTDTLDIHAGGRDLIFPHHENEIAQAQAKTAKPFANYWIHHGLLTIESQKMAKSSGNFITIKYALKKYPVDALKIFYLQAHYSSSMDFSEKSMEAAKATYANIDGVMRRLVKRYKTKDASKVVPEALEAIEGFKDKFIECMDDDFNTPNAFAVLFELIHRCNNQLQKKDMYSDCFIGKVTDLIKEMAGIFGLVFMKDEDPELKKFAESRIEERNLARKNKDFKKADSIRDELLSKGIAIEDTKEGTTWRKL